jgi:hypothetical protein
MVGFQVLMAPGALAVVAAVRTFLLMDLPTQISMEFAEANEAGPHGRAS